MGGGNAKAKGPTMTTTIVITVTADDMPQWDEPADAIEYLPDDPAAPWNVDHPYDGWEHRFAWYTFHARNDST